MHARDIAVWVVSGAAVGAILVRPFRVAEWLWPVAAALILVVTGLVSGSGAARAVWDGLDVYLFLIGMIALAELGRVHRVFDWLSAGILRRSNGDRRRAFGWVYLTGVLVTTLLSNDGTIVLLTPAVLALTKRAGLPRAPYVYACAFVANAASFVLPISNPANLLVFRHLPKIGPWLAMFALPAAASIALTFVILRIVFRRPLAGGFHSSGAPAELTLEARVTLVVLSISMAVVAAAAGLGLPVGAVALTVAAVSAIIVSIVDRAIVPTIAREGPWSIVPLVAGLFVIVEALDRTGVLQLSRSFFRSAGTLAPVWSHLVVGAIVTVADNVLNNLPVGVLTRYALHGGAITPHATNAVLVGIDLGPNLSVTGSLATLLWVLMLRRDGINISPWRFLAIGAAVTVPTLTVALICLR